MPFISVCIPAYNRPELLTELLDSILKQDFDDYEIVICEDQSPKRKEIASVVAAYSKQNSQRIRYFENEVNLGYDANLRRLLEKAQGDYCLFMGNDDLMCDGALNHVCEALKRHPNVGVLLRSYASFEGVPTNIVQEFRYFNQETFFPAGAQTISTVYRRSVVISGMVVHRHAALALSSDHFDGTLLYQLYLVANILVEMNAVYLPEIITLYRNGGVPDFGNSEKEKGKFVPTEQTPESSLHFMQGMLDIVTYTEKTRDVAIYKPILEDIGNYSYPIIAIQFGKSLPVFLKYCWGLAKLGFWKNKMFYFYFVTILILGVRRTDNIIAFFKRRMGYTLVIGSVYKGKQS